jgi:hypothetical protein
MEAFFLKLQGLQNAQELLREVVEGAKATSNNFELQKYLIVRGFFTFK